MFLILRITNDIKKEKSTKLRSIREERLRCIGISEFRVSLSNSEITRISFTPSWKNNEQSYECLLSFRYRYCYNLRIIQIFFRKHFLQSHRFIKFPDIDSTSLCLHIDYYRFDEKCVIKISIVVIRIFGGAFRADKEIIIAVIWFNLSRFYIDPYPVFDAINFQIEAIRAWS